MNQGPYLASVQKGEEEYSPEDHDFGSCGEAVISEEPVRDCSLNSMSRFDTFDNLSFAGAII